MGPDWVHNDVGNAIEKFMEQKWKDALKVAAVEPRGWEGSGVKAEKMPAERATGLAQKAIANFSGCSGQRSQVSIHPHH
jgi:hypothetical protein